ncbi:hypothetical protein ACFY2J_06210 [Streptomyces collinus]|uniref:hypothetical protein n=1 Tax=Streptomyces collinus TaxID=42684 RepID=UPI0036CA946D
MYEKNGVPVQDPLPKKEQRSFPPVSDPTCQTMLDIRDGEGASTIVLQVFNWKGDIWGGGSMLASYEGGKAQQVFAQLKQALGSCRSYEGTGWVRKFKSTLTMEQAPDVGDEAVRFREGESGRGGRTAREDGERLVVGGQQHEAT